MSESCLAPSVKGRTLEFGMPEKSYLDVVDVLSAWLGLLRSS